MTYRLIIYTYYFDGLHIITTDNWAWPKREDFANLRPILFYRTVSGYIVAIFYSRAPQCNTSPVVNVTTLDYNKSFYNIFNIIRWYIIWHHIGTRSVPYYIAIVCHNNTRQNAKRNVMHFSHSRRLSRLTRSYIMCALQVWMTFMIISSSVALTKQTHPMWLEQRVCVCEGKTKNPIDLVFYFLYTYNSSTRRASNFTSRVDRFTLKVFLL